MRTFLIDFFIIIILIVTKNVYESTIEMLSSHGKGKKYRNVTILDYDGNVINEPNGLILYCCNVILLIKDSNNADQKKKKKKEEKITIM